MASPELPVTKEDLQILVSAVTDAQAPFFIDSAHSIILAKGIVGAYDGRTAYLIELYVAASFASSALPSAVVGNAVTQTKVGQSEERYSDPTVALLGLSSNKYGQMAIALDTLGLLTSLSTKAVKAQFQIYATYQDEDEFRR